MTAAPPYRERFAAFPGRADHARRWRELAAEIAARGDAVTEDPPAVPETPGELVVIGSGIESVGFTSTDELLISEADEVFYCVADPATLVWLKARRPDAYDLYVLYDDAKLRYVTYMQMTEAMLHPVRQGKKVLAIFYGHPGVFVLATHRAIAIARREGHRATMRAAVSALDTLCADLGVDPSHPGMVTYEATDMLIRGRRPDTSLHVVLWQVGLIGELGYRRSGYLNNGLSVLLDYLESHYGPDQAVVNYIGSRYPGIPPVTDEHTVKALREPDVQATVTGISTFYLPPKDSAPVDEAMLARLGLLAPGQRVTAPPGPLREIDRYGPRERQAFAGFARFHVPPGYHWQEDTAAARFVLALREDGALRDRYARDPAAAVRAWATPDLGVRERALLSRGEAGAVQVAAKGVRSKADPEAARLLRDTLTSRSRARGLLRAARAGTHQAWAATHGYSVDWAALPEDLELVLRNALYPWSGWYLDPASETSVVVLASPASDRVYLDGALLRGTAYARGVLRWRGSGGTSGQLHPDATPRGARRLVGAVWPAGETAGPEHRLTLAEHRLTGAPPPAAVDVAPERLHGTYVTRTARGLGSAVVGAAGVAFDGGPPVPVAESGVTLLLDPVTSAPMLFGTVRGEGVVGMAQPPAAPDGAGLGLPPWAREHVTRIVLDAAPRGGVFAWHTAEKAELALRAVRAAVRAAAG